MICSVVLIAFLASAIATSDSIDDASKDVIRVFSSKLNKISYFLKYTFLTLMQHVSYTIKLQLFKYIEKCSSNDNRVVA